MKMTRDEFVRYVLDGGKGVASKKEAKAAKAVTDALPDGFETKFGAPVVPAVAEAVAGPEKLFAEKLLRGCGFGEAETLDRARVILGDNPAAKYLSEKVLYWQKDTERPYQTLLFETDQKWTEIAREPFFKTKHSAHLDLLEDALTRLVQSALEGFQRGGEGRTADVKRGQQNETLCVISLVDDRDPADATRLVCLGTVNAVTGSLEVFFLRESCRSWEKQPREEYLGALYERQFKKLTTSKWQEAFTTEEERKLARDLVKECEGGGITEKKLANRVIGLLDEIAKGFGLRKKAGEDHRLTLTKLPEDHDIGADPDDTGGINPFAGMSVRDEKRRLLGYIVYCLTKKADVDALRARLKEHNRFHNVLVVYPDKAQASFELWQGRDSLEGRLTKQGAKFTGEAQVISLLSRFFVVSRAKVKNPAELADELASRAKYLRRLAEKQLEKEKSKGHLRDLFKAFKEALIHDMTEESFADAFAQTLTYGLLTARWLSRDEIEEKGERFTRETALKHLPSTSPFLRGFFQQALDATFAPNLIWLLEDIAELLDRVNINEVFGRGDQGADPSTDPVIHFYEPFLAAYDPDERQKRGVYYTPRPVVSYIVSNVDRLLKDELGVDDGLASTLSWGEVLAMHPELKKPDGVTLEDQFVRILDPATGTATFLVACIDVIEKTVKEAAKKKCKTTDIDSPSVIAVWQKYVTEQLLPRLFGFEVMVAPYVIAHLKIGLKLRDSGIRLGPKERINVLLTNSLEPPEEFSKQLTLGVPALAQEGRLVNEVKGGRPFTVVIGNPPYSGHSGNNQVAWIVDKVHDYRRGLPDLQKPGQAKWLQDDYVKFIRYSEYLIVHASVGVFGFITNHSYLINPTFRGMRRHLMDSFGRIDIVDLHGNSKRDEGRQAGEEADENVFDIQQGVAIILAAKGGPNHEIRHSDRWGTRTAKYQSLSLDESGTANVFEPKGPLWLFVPRNDDALSEYERGWKIQDIFSVAGDPAPGMVTTHDEFAIAFSESEIAKNVETLLATSSEAEARNNFRLCSQSQWNYKNAKIALGSKQWKKKILPILYRPFDVRYTIDDANVAVHRRERVLRHLTGTKNLALLTDRQVTAAFRHVFCTRAMANDCALSTASKERTYVLPLFVVQAENALAFEDPVRPNLNPAFLAELATRLALATNGKFGLPEGISPEMIFNYLYAVLHSPTYRARYEGFLRSEFPRIPLPRDVATFHALAGVGAQLVDAHLFESKNGTKQDALRPELVGRFLGEIERVEYLAGTVWVDRQRTFGFRGIPESAWNFRVGGYQVLEKWLKDRKGRPLTPAEIEHYRQIVVAVQDTITLMNGVDDAVLRHGGWPSAFGSALATGQ